jgi:HSP20 family protein
MAATAPEAKVPEANEPQVPAKAEPNRLRMADPMEFFEEMQQELARLWGQRPLFPSIFPRTLPIATKASSWVPRVDVYEANGDLVIHAELPGVEKQDIKLTLDSGDLLIEGERKTEEKVEEKDYYRMERMAGSFYRRLPLPAEVKPEQINAQYKDGVLEIRIPKGAPGAPAQKIGVK